MLRESKKLDLNSDPAACHVKERTLALPLEMWVKVLLVSGGNIWKSFIDWGVSFFIASKNLK
jgi:hypothetical protein